MSQPVLTYIATNLNHNTFIVRQIREWVEDHCKGLRVLNLFCGPTMLRGCIEVRNDLDKKVIANYHMDALSCIKMLKDEIYLSHRQLKFDRVLIDPPYSKRKAIEYYDGRKSGESSFKRILDVVPYVLLQKGKVITFGYQASVMGKERGFELEEVLVIDHHGAQHSTLACVEGFINAPRSLRSPAEKWSEIL